MAAPSIHRGGSPLAQALVAAALSRFIGHCAPWTRAAVVVTATEILTQRPRTLQVIPITGNATRRMRTELDIP